MADSKSRITTKVVELAADKAGVDVAEVTPASHFVNDLNMDSLARVELTMAVEDEIHVTVPDDAHDRLLTVGHVVDYVAEQQTDDSPEDVDPPA